MAPKKIRCKADDCKEAVQRMFGDCGFCQRQFCAKHRLPEDHTCSGLDDVCASYKASMTLTREYLANLIAVYSAGKRRTSRMLRS